MSALADDTAESVIDGLAWACVDFISDLHLQASEPANWRAFDLYLQQTSAQALFVLGDLFEVWVGDDVLTDPTGGFEQQVVQALAQTAQRMPVYWLAGNRDFLTGPGFVRASGVRPMSDPSVLRLADQNCLLTHGDALCLSDLDYMAFRQEVRQAEWQRAFLSKPLAERQALARQMREQSQSRQSGQREYADVDAQAARERLKQTHTHRMIHGHTHRPAEHDLGEGLTRVVLSDWCVEAEPARAEVLRWSLDRASDGQGHWRRIRAKDSAQK